MQYVHEQFFQEEEGSAPLKLEGHSVPIAQLDVHGEALIAWYYSQKYQLKLAVLPSIDTLMNAINGAQQAGLKRVGFTVPEDGENTHRTPVVFLNEGGRKALVISDSAASTVVLDYILAHKDKIGSDIEILVDRGNLAGRKRHSDEGASRLDGLVLLRDALRINNLLGSHCLSPQTVTHGHDQIICFTPSVELIRGTHRSRLLTDLGIDDDEPFRSNHEKKASAEAGENQTYLYLKQRRKLDLMLSDVVESHGESQLNHIYQQISGAELFTPTTENTRAAAETRIANEAARITEKARVAADQVTAEKTRVASENIPSHHELTKGPSFFNKTTQQKGRGPSPQHTDTATDERQEDQQPKP